jgi:hypothetical protein
VNLSTATDYERPFVDGPFHAYEQPMLLDLESAASCNWGCATSGDSAPAPENPEAI